MNIIMLSGFDVFVKSVSLKGAPGGSKRISRERFINSNPDGEEILDRLLGNEQIPENLILWSAQGSRVSWRNAGSVISWVS